MIQLTKGTNVLDINLSDFSGAGQDVVQNGSFNDIGSDLVQNGDFAEIGSELVTNGDFSAVPLGGELVTDGNFPTPNVNWSLSSSFTIANNKLHCLSDGTYEFAYQSSVFEIGKSYVITFDITGWTLGTIRVRPTAESPFQTASANGSYSFFYVAVENTQLIIERDSGACNMFLENISVKEATNLVTNPNFTDTGSELMPTIGTIVNAGGGSITLISGISYSSTSDGTSGSSIRPKIDLATTSSKSYKLVITPTSTPTGTTNCDFYDGASYLFQDYDFTTTKEIYFVDNGSVFLSFDGAQIYDVPSFTISVKELGEDWTANEAGTDTVTFANDQVQIVSDGVSGATGILQSGILTIGKSYKVTIDVASNTNKFKIILGGGSIEVTGTGVQTFYGEATATALYLYRISSQAVDAVINSIVVQELGEDWSEIVSDPDSASFVENGLKIVQSSDLGIDSRVFQTSVTQDDKSYKVTYTIHSISLTSGNSVKYYNGAAYVVLPEQGVGTHTFYYTRQGTLDNWIFNLATPVTSATDFVTISSISVKEVGQDWTIQQPDGQLVTFPNSTLSIVYDSTETQASTGVYQDILTIGKYYKIEIDVASITGDLKLQVGSDSQVINTTGTSYFYTKSDSARIYIVRAQNGDSVSGVVNSISIKQLDTNGRWVTFADPDSKSVMKLGQVDLEIDSSGNNCGVYQTGLIKPNKLYIITINMKATAAIYVEIAASLGTAVSAVIGTELLTTSYKEYSFEYVTPFAVDHDLQIHRLFGSGANQTISIDYVSMNGVDESQWTNDPTWDPFAKSLVFVPTLTDESTNNSKQFTLDTLITDGGWDGRSLHGQVIINEFPTEVPAAGIINLKQPDFLEGFYQVEIRGYLGTFYRVLGKCMAHLERTSTEDGYNRFESYNDTVTYKAYEE